MSTHMLTAVDKDSSRSGTGDWESGTTSPGGNGTLDSTCFEQIRWLDRRGGTAADATPTELACGQVTDFLCGTIHESNQPPKNLNNILKRRFY
jgi:hypothetical protein